MVPVSGSAYTYTYAVMGEMLAWMVGWALILEYAVGASAVAVGWSGYLRRPDEELGHRHTAIRCSARSRGRRRGQSARDGHFAVLSPSC